jgi:hypothetical protein
MAKFKFTLNIGQVGGREEIEEIPDEDLEGLEGEERENVIQEYYDDWRFNYIDGGWEELD